MPLYEYKCKNCEFQFEIFASIHSDPLTECVECDNGLLETVYYPVNCYVKNDPKTVGLLAERNNQKMGRFEYEDKLRSKLDSKKAKLDARKNAGLIEGETRAATTGDTLFRKPDLNLLKKSPQEIEDYIVTGKK